MHLEYDFFSFLCSIIYKIRWHRDIVYACNHQCSCGIACYSKSKKIDLGTELLLFPMSLSNVEKEQQCTLHWFQSWSPMQKADFMKDLLEKASPCNVDTLFDAMHSLNVRDRPPSIFQCQVKLFTQWFEEYGLPKTGMHLWINFSKLIQCSFKHLMKNWHD